MLGAVAFTRADSRLRVAWRAMTTAAASGVPWSRGTNDGQRSVLRPVKVSRGGVKEKA